MEGRRSQKHEHAGSSCATWSPPPGLIDVHTHAIPPQLPELTATAPWDRWPKVERLSEDRARILVGDTMYRDIDDRCWSAKRRLADMDTEGVAAQLLSPVPITLCHDGPSDGAALLARAQNDFFASLVAAAPHRFRALGAVPLQDPELAVEELVRCVQELGFPGVEIGTRVGNTELADPELDPFFDKADKLGAMILVHPVDSSLDPRLGKLGISFGVGMPSETTVAAGGLLMSTAVSRRPNLRICLAHGGGAVPGLLPRLDRGRQLVGTDESTPFPGEIARSFYCDSLTYDIESLRLAVHRFGSDHVLLGTDYPFAARENPAGRVFSDTQEMQLRDAISRNNALDLINSTENTVTSATQGQMGEVGPAGTNEPPQPEFLAPQQEGYS